MEKTLQVSFDQIIPFSKARAEFSSLIDEVRRKKYIVISKKYRPAVALVNLKFLTQVLSAYQEWQREQAFKVIDRIRAKNLDKTSEEVERDVSEAIAAVRAGWKLEND